MKKIIKFLIVILIALFLIIAIYSINKEDLLKILQDNNYIIYNWINENYFSAIFLYITLMITAVTLTIPIGVVLTIASGYFFGIITGTILSSIGSTIGCAISFILIRYLTTNYKNLSKFKKAENILKHHPTNYIIALHIMPATPIFLINTIAALSPIRLRNFIIATFIGLTPSNIVYTLVGQKLTDIKSIRDLITPELIFIFIVMALLSLVPILIKYFRSKNKKLVN